MAPIAASILGPLSYQPAIPYLAKTVFKNEGDDFWAVDINDGCLSLNFSMHPSKNHTDRSFTITGSFLINIGSIQ